jgi:hypothetical protein
MLLFKVTKNISFNYKISSSKKVEYRKQLNNLKANKQYIIRLSIISFPLNESLRNSF